MSKMAIFRKKGIDLSSWQSAVDWGKAAKEIDFVMLRCGFGNSTSQIDRLFKCHISGAIRAGIKHIGIYHFSYARSVKEAEIEADVCLKLIEPYKKYITMPVAFDWEYDSKDYCVKNGVTPTKARCDAMAQAFCKKIKAAGYKPMLYTNPDYASRYFTLSKYEHIWIAQYASSCQIPGVDIWQYTSSGKISGIDGNVDMNLCYNESYFKKEESYMSFKKGDKNDGVLAVKMALRQLHRMGKVPSKPDTTSTFGDGTEADIKAVQKLAGLPQTGIADTATIKAIDTLFMVYDSTGDVNHDGKVNMSDVTDLQKKIAGIK